MMATTKSAVKGWKITIDESPRGRAVAQLCKVDEALFKAQMYLERRCKRVNDVYQSGAVRELDEELSRARRDIDVVRQFVRTLACEPKPEAG